MAINTVFTDFVTPVPADWLNNVNNVANEHINVKTLGAKGNGVADDTVAFQNAITTITATGGTLYIPPGNYKISSTLTIQEPIADDGLTQINIIGAGSGNTQLLYGGTGACLTIQGGTGTNFASHLWMGGFRLQASSWPTISASDGLHLTNIAWSNFYDIAIEGFTYGILGINILSTKFDKPWINGCTNGVLLQQVIGGGGSDPNAITIFQPYIGNCVQYGMTLADPTTVNILGGSFEENGNGATGGLGNAIIVNSQRSVALNGAMGVNIIGTYFEGTFGQADINLQSGGTDGSTLFTVQSCTFNRITNTAGAFVTNNILFALGSNTNSKSQLVVKGCGFNGFNTYVPSSGTPYIAVSSAGAPWDFSDGGGSNMYGSNIEKPVLSGPVKTLQSFSSCWANYNGATSTLNNSYNVTSVTKNGTGDYTFNFARPLSNTLYSAAVSLFSIGFAQISTQTVSSIRVLTFNTSSVATDMTLGLVIHGSGDTL